MWTLARCKKVEAYGPHDHENQSKLDQEGDDTPGEQIEIERSSRESNLHGDGEITARIDEVIAVNIK